jgi:lipopolysaccharide assembly protein A
MLNRCVTIEAISATTHADRRKPASETGKSATGMNATTRVQNRLPVGLRICVNQQLRRWSGPACLTGSPFSASVNGEQSTREASMRLVYLIVIVLLAAAAVVFVVQNRDPLTISFLGFSVSAPVAILSAVMYCLGAVTGGSLFALLRHSVRKL